MLHNLLGRYLNLSTFAILTLLTPFVLKVRFSVSLMPFAEAWVRSRLWGSSCNIDHQVLHKPVESLSAWAHAVIKEKTGTINISKSLLFTSCLWCVICNENICIQLERSSIKKHFHSWVQTFKGTCDVLFFKFNFYYFF